MASIIRWQPARPADELSRFLGTGPATPAAAYRRWAPAVDVVERDEQYVVKADLPGLTEADVTVEYENDVLTISGERANEHESREGGVHRVERSSGRFSRALRFPRGVDVTAVAASFANGVLEVRVPKPAAAKAHRIAVTVGETPAPALDAAAADDTAAAAA